MFALSAALMAAAPASDPVEPGVLPRALELLAKRGLVPARVFAQADADQLSVEIEVEGLTPDTADHVGRCLSQIVGVRQTF